MTSAVRRVDDLERLQERGAVVEIPRWVYPYSRNWVGTAGSPLTSTAWDGDSFSTTAKTVIDLSTVFGVPAGVKAVYVRVLIRDSGSAAAATAELVLSPNDTAGSGVSLDCAGRPNDIWERQALIVPCSTGGDIYYQVIATGASTMDVYIQIWGYCI